jgi:hypothetical protein
LRDAFCNASRYIALSVDRHPSNDRLLDNAAQAWGENAVLCPCGLSKPELGNLVEESLSPEPEMVEDPLAIVHTFPCRLYGMRKYSKQINKDFPGSRD